MDLIIGFMIFIGAMIVCLIQGYTMVIALFVGLIVFVAIGHLRGFKTKAIYNMGVSGLKDALVVVEIMFIIGFITAIWRSSGTIAFFVYYGIKIITPSMFLVITFLLSCLLSYALGTSFGVAGTVGVIFMALARSGGVNELITAGVIMSGIYFGDRGSPVSSSAILVATITHTKILDNVKLMMKTGLIPFAITLAIYIALSIGNPIKHVDSSILFSLKDEFNLSLWCILPAICMLVLPLIKVKVIYSMVASAISGIIVSVLVEKMSIWSVLVTMIQGHKSTGSLAEIINGGGLISMIEVVFIVAISSTYSGIFSGTKMLMSVQDKIEILIKKIGRFGATVALSLATLSIFCNQTIASMMCSDIMMDPYKKSGGSKEELAIDLENSVILLAGVVPWAIACSVPLVNFMQVGFKAILFSFFLFLVPICYSIQKKVSNPFSKE